MKNIIYTLTLVVLLSGCKSDDGAKVSFNPNRSPTPEMPIEPTPTPTPTPTIGVCHDDYLRGTWTHIASEYDLIQQNPTETYIFNSDCTGRNVLCEFDFQYPPEGYTADFDRGLGWDEGPYNFRMSHLTGPAQTKLGCTQYQAIPNSWHACNLFPMTANTMRFDCNGEVNGFIFTRQ